MSIGNNFLDTLGSDFLIVTLGSKGLLKLSFGILNFMRDNISVENSKPTRPMKEIIITTYLLVKKLANKILIVPHR